MPVSSPSRSKGKEIPTSTSSIYPGDTVIPFSPTNSTGNVPTSLTNGGDNIAPSASPSLSRSGLNSSRSRVEQIRERTGVGYVGLNVSAEDLEEPEDNDSRAVVWFDIDNTLYHKSTRIAQLMGQRIHAYFLGLGLPEAEAKRLHTRYYKEHGLAIRGLLKHHKDVDPLDYDRRVDGSLPLDDLLKPEPKLTALLRDLDRSQCRVYALTNAYKSHGLRCIRLLGLEQFFDGLVYCDYAAGPLFCCKPDFGYYQAAAEIVRVKDPSKFYFVDDSEKNILAAKELGWQSAVFYNEPEPDVAQVHCPDDTSQTQDEEKAVQSLNHGGLISNGSVHHLDEEAIKRQLRSMSSSQRLKLFDLILTSAMPGELPSMNKALMRHVASNRNVVNQLTEDICIKIFEKLTVKQLLACRLVSKKWSHIVSLPALWRSHALALTESDPEPPLTPAHEEDWQTLVKGLYFRERNWSLGLAQNIQFCHGHTGFVTSMKLRGRNVLATGSYDGSIRIWDLSTPDAPTCTKEIKADKIACLDFFLSESGGGTIAAGLYDVGRTLVFDLQTGEQLQTLSGHNKGIRNVAINKHYLVSVGQDKAICVWNYKTGERLMRFGQQSNVSLGVCLVDNDKLVAVTIDGVIRSFSIRSKKMIGEFHLSKLGTAGGEFADLIREMAGDSGMLSWFAAHRTSITIASKSLVAHLEWQEHIVPVRPINHPSEDSYSRSPRARVDSRASATSSCASAVSTPAKDYGKGATNRPGSTKIGAPLTVGSPAARRSAPPQSPTAARSKLAPSTPINRMNNSPTLSPPFTPADRGSPASHAMPRSLSASSLGFANADSETSSTRLAPNLAVPPRIVSVLRTPEVAVGAIDPQKRRVVCARRFSSRVGADRKIYTSTYSADCVPTIDDQSSTVGPSQTTFRPIAGAWETHSVELSTPERNPMAVVLDHESVVVGCSDGLVYRVGFVGAEYGPAPVTPVKEVLPVVGDATITDLDQLRTVAGWRDLFLPEGTKDDHPGRIKVDVVKKVGLR